MESGDNRLQYYGDYGEPIRGDILVPSSQINVGTMYNSSSECFIVEFWLLSLDNNPSLRLPLISQSRILNILDMVVSEAKEGRCMVITLATHRQDPQQVAGGIMELLVECRR